jgi:uncharacterized protein (TIGR03437 family)
LALPGTTNIATDSSGALYILSICQADVSCVTKLSADGTTILWQNNLGVLSEDDAMAVDPSGGVYVIPSYLPGDRNVYVAKLGAGGKGIAWKTAVAVDLNNLAITADSQGRIYVAGTIGPEFITSVVIRLNAAGSAVDYTVQMTSSVVSVAADGTGGVFVTGDGAVPFIARIGPDGSVVFNTLLLALGSAEAVAVDPNGNAVVYGTATNGSTVLLHIDSSGAVSLSSVVGSSTWTVGGSNFVLDAEGNAYVTGSAYVYNSGLPDLIPVRNSLATCGSEWLNVLAPDGSVLQATYLPPGGESIQEAPFIATGPDSAVFVVHSSGASFSATRAGPFLAGASATDLPSFYLLSLSPNADAQIFPLACLGNSASYLTGSIAPGEIITLFGSGLGPQQGVQLQATLQTPFPTQAANVEVTFDGMPAPLLWAQDGQVNVVAPWSLTVGQSTQVCVAYDTVKTNCLNWPVAATAPAVFTVDGVHAAALNQDGSVNSANNPAQPGSIVSVFATGLGPITPPQADGTLVGFPLPMNLLAVTVGFTVVNPPFGATIFNPFEVTYAGPAPYLVAGASQVNFKIPPLASQDDAYTYSSEVDINVILASTQSQAFAVYVASQ